MDLEEGTYNLQAAGGLRSGREFTQFVTPVEFPVNMANQDITPSQLDTLGFGVRRIDVREPDEYTGPLGHLPGTELVPLATVEEASASWSREAPLLLICRSGARSAKAAQALARRGFTHLYHLAGGMLAVRETPAARPHG
jgi:rhodanese-related sulfurtransferase